MTPIVTLVVFLSSLAYILGGFLVLLKRNWSENNLMSLVALSAGLLLAIALLDLIPDTESLLKNSNLFVMIGFLTMYVIFLSTKPNKNNPTTNHNIVITGLLVGMLLHNFFEGLSIGISYSVNFRLGVIVSIALVIHKIPEGLSYSSAMLASINNRKKTAIYLIMQGLSTWCGAGAAIFLSELKGTREQIVAIALSLTAGIFLYLGGTTMLPAINQKTYKKIPLFFVGGILFYFVLHSLSEALS